MVDSHVQRLVLSPPCYESYSNILSSHLGDPDQPITWADENWVKSQLRGIFY